MAETEPTSSGETVNPSGMTLGNRLVNVFVSPAEVFDDVRSSPPNAANWGVPLVLTIITSLIYVIVVFSQPAIMQRVRDAQDAKMQQMVDAGKLNREQADKSSAMMEKFTKVIVMVTVFIAQPVMLFFVALIFWLLGKWAMSGNSGYMKSVEATGLASMITIPGAIIGMLLAVIYGDQHITPGPVLLVSHFDPNNKVHLILSVLNLASIWYVAVVAIGLSKLSGASFIKAAIWCFGLWAVLALGSVLIFGGK